MKEQMIDAFLLNLPASLSCGRECVSSGDLKRLLPGRMLNDAIINFYGSIILQYCNISRLYITPTQFWSRLEESSDKARILVRRTALYTVCFSSELFRLEMDDQMARGLYCHNSYTSTRTLDCFNIAAGPQDGEILWFKGLQFCDTSREAHASKVYFLPNRTMSPTCFLALQCLDASSVVNCRVRIRVSSGKMDHGHPLHASWGIFFRRTQCRSGT